MTSRRTAIFVAFVLLALLGIAAAESLLAALIVVFSLFLQIDVSAQFGPDWVALYGPGGYKPDVMLFGAATSGSIAFTAVCGLGAAAWRFVRWQRAR
jgi:hypothetical protein